MDPQPRDLSFFRNRIGLLRKNCFLNCVSNMLPTNTLLQSNKKRNDHESEDVIALEDTDDAIAEADKEVRSPKLKKLQKFFELPVDEELVDRK